MNKPINNLKQDLVVTVKNCSGLNENVHSRLVHLNTWSPVGGAIWRSTALPEEVHYWGGLGGFIALPHFLFSPPHCPLFPIDR